MKKAFRQFAVGTAAYVVAHAEYMASLGRNPSVKFLTNNNPRKALVSARAILESQNWQGLVTDTANQIAPGLLGKPFDSMKPVEVEIVLRHIVATSSSEEEILKRIKGELGCPYTPSLSFKQPKDRVEREACELVKALGGLITKNGAMVMMTIFGPQGEVITV